MKKPNKLSLILSCLGVLILIAMGLNLVPGHSNLMIFLGVACFVIAGFWSKACGSCCKHSKDNTTV